MRAGFNKSGRKADEECAALQADKRVSVGAWFDEVTRLGVHDDDAVELNKAIAYRADLAASYLEPSR